MKIFSTTEELAIRKVHRDFYDAIESLDIGKMENVWLNDDSIECVHPGWSERQTGWKEVIQSWYSIFQNTQYIEFTLKDVRIRIEDALAIVTCTESMMSSLHGEIVYQDALATNVFQKLGDRWWLILHHAG